MMQEKKHLFITVVISLLLSFMHCPWFEIFFDDKEIFKYTGLVIYKGGVPYRDFFDHKPPLIYFLNYAGVLLGGDWGLWVLDATLVLFSTIQFLKLCKANFIKQAWVLPTLFNLMIRDKAVSFGVGMTREYTSIFILLFVCVMLGNNKYKYWLLGILSGLVFFMQQDQILVLLPFLLYSVFINKNDWKTFLKKNLQLLLGTTIVVTLIFVYFIYHEAFRYFWEDAFLFNFRWYNHSHSFFENAKTIRNFLHLTAYEMPFYISVTIGCLSLLWGNSKRVLLMAALLAVSLSFCAAFVSGKLTDGLGILYYFLPLSVTIPVLLFTLFSSDNGAWLTKTRQQILVAAILFISPVLTTMQHTLHLPYHTKDNVKKSLQYQYLYTRQLKDYDLYVAFNANDIYLYNDFKILAPSKWVYHFFWAWFENWDADLKIIQSITADLDRHKTAYVLDYSDGYYVFKNKRVYDHWKKFLNEYYTLEKLDNANTVKLWRLKNN